MTAMERLIEGVEALGCPDCGGEYVVEEAWPETRVDPESWTGHCTACDYED